MKCSVSLASSTLVLMALSPTAVFSDTNRGYFLAPDTSYSAGISNSVDIANGNLITSSADLFSKSINFSHIYSPMNQNNDGIDGWDHNFSSHLITKTSYQGWKGLKSNQYSSKRNACLSGWDEIRESIFNGQLSEADVKFKNSSCLISLNGELKARLAIHKNKKRNKEVILSRPGGETITFIKEQNKWKTLSGELYQLTRRGNKWIIRTASDNVETYSNVGVLKSIKNSSGQRTSLKYHKGKLVKITGPFGRTINLAYDQGRLSTVESALGNLSFQYTEDLLTQVIKADGSSENYTYSNDKLSQIGNASGQAIISIEYDSNGRVAAKAGLNGTNAYTFSYPDGSNFEVTNVANNTTETYELSVVNGSRKVAQFIDSDEQAITNTLDENGFPEKTTLANGSVTITRYNDRGLLVSQTEMVGTDQEKTTRTIWHNKFRKPLIEIENNTATKYSYNRKGLLTKTITGTIKDDKYCKMGANHYMKSHHHNHHYTKLILENKATTRYRYNNKGQLVKKVLPTGAIVLTTYDNNGNRTSDKNALGHTNSSLEFDARGIPTKTQSANGIVTDREYGTNLREVKSLTTNGLSIDNKYDNAGRKIETVYSDGSALYYEYDDAGNQIKKTDEKGNTTSNSYDAAGNQTRETVKDSSGNVVFDQQSVFNNKNELIKTIDANGDVTEFEYDSYGNQIKVTDAKGNTTVKQYDLSNRVVSVTDVLGGVTQYEYDNNGNRTKVITANGATTMFEYNDDDQLVREVSPDRGTISYVYDLAGNQTQISNQNGDQKSISYDLLNRKTGESWLGSPDLTVTYFYDACDNGIGKLCKITDNTGSTSFKYNPSGKIIEKTQELITSKGVVNLTKAYEYDELNKLVSETLPSGATIAYTYDSGRLNSISIDGSAYINNIQYNAANQLTGWLWSDGTLYNRSYDVKGKLNSITLADVSRTITYDSLENITGWTDDSTNESKSFSYDSLNRLSGYSKLSLSEVLESQNFSYDANGNRLIMDEGEIQTIYTILDDANRLMSVNNVVYEYDSNGNIIDDGQHNYSYDARNRLAELDGTSSYFYNANSMRVRKVTPLGETLYAWDNERIYAEYDVNGQVIQETVYLDSIPVALLSNGATHRIFADQIDTPRVITDEGNNVLWAWNSKPFGESAPDEDVDKDGVNLTYNLRFPGHYYDAEAGSNYNFNRNYNPATGRYTQSDPIGLEGGNNTYSYVSNNPLINTDTLGLSQYDGKGCPGTSVGYGVAALAYFADKPKAITFSTTAQHINRNQNNWCPIEEPKKIVISGYVWDTIEYRDAFNYLWSYDNQSAQDCYHGGWLGYRTYRDDTRSQCTYTSSGSLVTTGLFRGTYDFKASGGVAHIQEDVLPHHANPRYHDPDLTAIY